MAESDPSATDPNIWLWLLEMMAIPIAVTVVASVTTALILLRIGLVDRSPNVQAKRFERLTKRAGRAYRRSDRIRMRIPMPPPEDRLWRLWWLCWLRYRLWWLDRRQQPFLDLVADMSPDKAQVAMHNMMYHAGER